MSSHRIAHPPVASAADVVAALASAGRPLGGEELALQIRAPRGDAMRALLDAVRRQDVRATTEPGDETLRWTLASRAQERVAVADATGRAPAPGRPSR
jgi:hypothetical protein